MYFKFKFLHKYVKYQNILLSLLLLSSLLLLTFIIIIINIIIIITILYMYIYIYIYYTSTAYFSISPCMGPHGEGFRHPFHQTFRHLEGRDGFINFLAHRIAF